MNFPPTFTLIVKTNMPKTEIVSSEGDIYKMNVHAQPEQGKANIEIIKYFKKKIQAQCNHHFWKN